MALIYNSILLKVASIALGFLFLFSVNNTGVNAGKTDLLTYNDPNYGTKVQYPSDWNFSINEGEPTFSPPGSDDSEEQVASVWFSKRNLNESTGIGYYLNYSRDYYDNFPDIDVTNAVSNITLDGYPAYRLEWNTTGAYGTYNTMKIGTIIGTEEYYITYEADAERYANYLPTVRKMISSFNIELSEKNLPYITILPTVWSDDNLHVYIVVEPQSKIISTKYVQDAVDAINKWSELLKKYSNNSQAWNFDIHVRTESLSESERFQFEDRFSPPANIILELKAGTEDDHCTKVRGESIYPRDISRFSVYSYVFTSCLGAELPHELVYSTVLHEFAHDLGIGHTYYMHGDLMCSGEEDKHEHQIITCASSQELKEVPSDLNVEGLIYRYGVDGFDTPNKKLKGEEPRYYQKLALGIDIDNKTKIDRFLTQGWTLYDFGRTEEAIRYFDRALSIDANDTDSLYAKGYTLDSLGQYDDAITNYERILSIDPDNSYALHGKGFALDNLGQYEEAISYYDKALVLDPEAVDTLYNKGGILFDLGRYQDAISYYDKVLIIDPNDTDSLYKKGYALDSLGIYEEALTYYDKVLSIDPKDSDALGKKHEIMKKIGID